MHRMRTARVIGLALTLTLAVGAPCRAVSLGQIDTFQGGTTVDWTSGFPNPNPPTVVSTGGPAGLGDMYLLVTSHGGSGPGSKPTTLNTAQWTGDFTAAGVTGISVWMRNFGATNLDLRLGLNGSGGDFVTSSHLVLPAGSAWQPFTFSLAPGDLVGGGNAAATLANVSQLTIFHNPSANFPGPAIAASLGIDNISAVPEPSTIAALAGLVVAGGLVVLWQRRRRPVADD